MKKFAVFGNDKSYILEAIYKYFKNKEIEIICLSDDLDSEFVSCAKKMGLNVFAVTNNNFFEVLQKQDIRIIALAGKCEYQNLLDNEKYTFLNTHQALLPSFDCENEALEAYKYGVKVSGVSIFRVADKISERKILAQYPVLIGNLAHYDEYIKGLEQIEEILYPPVIEAVLNDNVFDFGDLLSNGGGCSGTSGGCGSGGCSGCGGCHQK